MIVMEAQAARGGGEPGGCLKAYNKRECVYVGEEPRDGYEGSSEVLKPDMSGTEEYKVIDVGEKEEVDKS